jgi:hypothetical protein
MVSNGRLDARNRGAVLDRLAGNEFGVLVIGGGVTGAGAVLHPGLGLRSTVHL